MKNYIFHYRQLDKRHHYETLDSLNRIIGQDKLLVELERFMQQEHWNNLIIFDEEGKRLKVRKLYHTTKTGRKLYGWFDVLEQDDQETYQEYIKQISLGTIRFAQARGDFAAHEVLKWIGKKGGQATLAKYGKEKMTEWGKRGGRPKKT